MHRVAQDAGVLIPVYLLALPFLICGIIGKTLVASADKILDEMTKL
jgi:hypothetical protein